MLEDPDLDTVGLVAALRASWGLEASAFTFVPGYDMHAATFDVATTVARVFLKVRFEAAPDTPLEVPRALLEAGVPNLLAPLRTRTGDLWSAWGPNGSLVLFPFVSGHTAMVSGMSADQWRTFGSTLRAVHDSPLAATFAGRLPSETFGLASASDVRSALELAMRPPVGSPAGVRLATLLRRESGRIDSMLERASELGRHLRVRTFQRVLCHADMHAANILVADDGGILLVDWDGPMLAPRERDLLFVIGSRIARDVEPHEEAWFFEGYGDVSVDGDALIYYRYERILEDIGEIGKSVFGAGEASDVSRMSEVTLAESFFEPGGILETVEIV